MCLLLCFLLIDLRNLQIHFYSNPMNEVTILKQVPLCKIRIAIRGASNLMGPPTSPNGIYCYLIFANTVNTNNVTCDVCTMQMSGVQNFKFIRGNRTSNSAALFVRIFLFSNIWFRGFLLPRERVTSWFHGEVLGKNDCK